MRASFLIGAFFIMFFLSGCSKTEDYLRVILKDNSDLIDPFSVQFRDLKYGKNFWCGELNVKNSLGGFVGWKPFYIDVFSPERPKVNIFSDDFSLSGKASDKEIRIHSLKVGMHDLACRDIPPARSYIPFWEH